MKEKNINFITMSYNVEPLKTVRLIDPIVDFNDEKIAIIKEGGSQVSYRSITSTSYSNSTAQFTAPPPNPGVAVHRVVYLRQPVTITFAGSDNGQLLLQSQYDAFRAFPLSQIIEVLMLRLNNTAVSINLSDNIEALMRYNGFNEELAERDYSMTPTYPDQTRSYDDLVNTIRNPLGTYYDTPQGSIMPRGGFDIESLVQTNTGAVLKATITEPLFISPLVFGTPDQVGLIGLQTFDLTVNYGNLERIWCHSNAGGMVDLSVSVDLAERAPTLLFKYITPKLIEQIPRSISYNYYNVERYPTTVGDSFTALETRRVSSNNIQLQSIPDRIYVYARLKNAVRTIQDPDVYMAIEGISVNWNNRSGLLSSASKRDLYDMSRRNGCAMSWTQWSGGPVLTSIGASQSSFGTVGGVLAIDFSKDIGLGSLEAPGLDGTYQLQYELNIKNPDPNNAIIGDQLVLYTVVISAGSFTIQDNRGISQIGIISREDILEAEESPLIKHQARIGFGNYYGELEGAGFFKDMGKFIKEAAKFLGPMAKELLPLIIKGLKGGECGGLSVAGQMMSRDRLKERFSR